VQKFKKKKLQCQWVNEMHGSKAKYPVKSLVRQHSAKGCNSGIKGLKNTPKFVHNQQLQTHY
jgi:hypothetical protein